MKNFLSIIWRLLKVIYVLFLVLGIGVCIIVWINTAPYSFITYSYKVMCNNGKAFDPTSKPIDHSPLSLDSIAYGQDRNALTFNDQEIKSECTYGTVFGISLSSNILKNYDFITSTNVHIIRTRDDQIKYTLIAFVSYYLFLEIIRRGFLYIIFGKNFLTLKTNNDKNEKK